MAGETSTGALRDGPRFAEAATASGAPIDITPVRPGALDAAGLTPQQAAFARAQGFDGQSARTALLPCAEGAIGRVLLGLGAQDAPPRERFATGAAIANLPDGLYRLEDPGGLIPAGEARDALALGYLLDSYRFDRYRAQPVVGARFVAPAGVDGARTEAIAAGEWLTRDLINTPAADMGPEALEAAIRALGAAHGATVSAIRGDALLAQGFPLIHAVGRAAAEAPRLIEMTWGTAGPCLTLVGKGICFDTGGLNLKPASSMGLMKKDMGGAATVLGLSRTIMALGLGMRLRVLIPAAENAVAGEAFRPGDILTARDGTTIEVNNTDAEGRLVLADALALAAEGDSDLTVCMATLTGAARIALGPDIAPFYTDDEVLARALGAAGAAVRDPVWRLPFHAPYEALIEPGIADLDNAPKGGMAGSITAALFLRRFAGGGRFVHFDIYGWQPTAAPGRPHGGAGQGARALLEALPRVLTR